MAAFLSSQLQAGDYCNTVWRVRDAAPTTTIETLLKPETWAHCARTFKQYDEIIVIPQGGPFRAHLIVMEAGQNFAKVRVLGVAMLNATTADYVPTSGAVAANTELPDPLPEDSPVGVKWNGPKHKYVAFRKADNEVLRPGFAIRAEAEDWARQHAAAMAA